jgi:hypothetical protein
MYVCMYVLCTLSFVVVSVTVQLGRISHSIHTDGGVLLFPDEP